MNDQFTGSISTSESILYKEVKLLKTPSRGIHYHSVRNSIPLLRQTFFIPDILKPYQISSKYKIKHLQKQGNNSLKIVLLKLLDCAFSNQKLFLTLKDYVYNEQNNLTLFLPTVYRQQYLQDQSPIRKLFVEFFHLMKMNNEYNKFQKFFQKHPFVQSICLAFLRSLMMKQGLAQAAYQQRYFQLKTILNCLSGSINFEYRIINQNLIQLPMLRQLGYLAQDDKNIYIVCYIDSENIKICNNYEQSQESDYQIQQKQKLSYFKGQLISRNNSFVDLKIISPYNKYDNINLEDIKNKGQNKQVQKGINTVRVNQRKQVERYHSRFSQSMPTSPDKFMFIRHSEDINQTSFPVKKIDYNFNRQILQKTSQSIQSQYPSIKQQSSSIHYNISLKDLNDRSKGNNSLKEQAVKFNYLANSLGQKSYSNNSSLQFEKIDKKKQKVGDYIQWGKTMNNNYMNTSNVGFVNGTNLSKNVINPPIIQQNTLSKPQLVFSNNVKIYKANNQKPFTALLKPSEQSSSLNEQRISLQENSKGIKLANGINTVNLGNQNGISTTFNRGLKNQNRIVLTSNANYFSKKN